MTRQCRRNGCAHPAAASLTFRYAAAQACLSELVDDPDPQQWDLCPSHAESLTVPRGWELVDVRVPAGADGGRDGRAQAMARADRPAAHRTNGPRRDRYAELHARLPALAAQVAAGSALLTGQRSTGTSEALPLEASGVSVS